MSRDKTPAYPAKIEAAKSRKRQRLKMLLVRRISMKALCIVSLILMSVGAMAGDSMENQSKKGFSDLWWLSFEESMFSESDALTVPSLPQGTRSYENKFTILAPKFAAGYRFAPKWSVELQMQFGPRESFKSYGKDKETNRSAAVESRFLATVVSREFALPGKLKLESKVGIARSWFDHSIGANEAQTKDFTISETRPVASLGIRSQITPRVSGGLEFSNYFLKRSKPVSTLTVGLRRSF